MKVAICPGSFDPVTKGHLDIISRACKTFDKVIVAVAKNPGKNPIFSVEERVELLQKVIEHENLNAEVSIVEGLLAEYVKQHNANVIIKGLRAMTDFEYEFQMALANKKLNPELETMFFATSSENMFLSSGLIKQIAGFGGDIADFVPQCILDNIKKRLCEGDE